MINYKEYIAKQFIGKKLHVKCDCIVSIDITGICIDYEVKSNEIIYIFDIDGKRVPVGENTPKLSIEVL